MQQPAGPAPTSAPLSRGLRRRARLGVVAATGALALVVSGFTATSAVAAEVTHTIAEVQGTGVATPLDATPVTVEGVVTADYRGASGYKGIVIQTQGSGGAVDATPGASDAIFVFLNSANPAVSIGDL